MDSINQQQPEQNRADLGSEEAQRKVKQLSEKIKTCFFCTGSLTDVGSQTRPMSIQKVDDDGIFWFLSASDSKKNAQLEQDETVKLFFQGSSYADFLVLSGTASITTDKNIIKDLWEPILKTWFTQGIDDPRITAIAVRPSEGYYWDTKHGKLVSFAKQIAGALTGKTLDDSIEGKLRL